MKENKLKTEMKFCPRCGSTNIYYGSGLPQIWSIWECRNCGYRGPLIVEDGDLALRLREDWEKEQGSGGGSSSEKGGQDSTADSSEYEGGSDKEDLDEAEPGEDPGF